MRMIALDRDWLDYRASPDELIFRDWPSRDPPLIFLNLSVALVVSSGIVAVRRALGPLR